MSRSNQLPQPDRRSFLGGLLASLAAPFVPKPTPPDAAATIRGVRATAGLRPWAGTGYTSAPTVSFSGGGGIVQSVTWSDSFAGRPESLTMGIPEYDRRVVSIDDLPRELADSLRRASAPRMPDPGCPIIVAPAIDPTQVTQIDTAAWKYGGWWLR